MSSSTCAASSPRGELGPDEGRYAAVENKSAARRYDAHTLLEEAVAEFKN